MANFGGGEPINVLFQGQIFAHILNSGDDAGSILKQLGLLNFDRSASVIGTDAPNYEPESSEFGQIPKPKIPGAGSKSGVHYSDVKRFVIKHLRQQPDGSGPEFRKDQPPSIEIIEA